MAPPPAPTNPLIFYFSLFFNLPTKSSPLPQPPHPPPRSSNSHITHQISFGIPHGPDPPINITFLNFSSAVHPHTPFHIFSELHLSHHSTASSPLLSSPTPTNKERKIEPGIFQTLDFLFFALLVWFSVGFRDFLRGGGVGGGVEFGNGCGWECGVDVGKAYCKIKRKKGGKKEKR